MSDSDGARKVFEALTVDRLDRIESKLIQIDEVVIVGNGKPAVRNEIPRLSKAIIHMEDNFSEMESRINKKLDALEPIAKWAKGKIEEEEAAKKSSKDLVTTIKKQIATKVLEILMTGLMGYLVFKDVVGG